MPKSRPTKQHGPHRRKDGRMLRTDVAHPTDPPPSGRSERRGLPALDVSMMVRVTVPALLLGLTLAVVVAGVAAPLSNADTYFHLRFGWEFLHGWSLRDP